MVADRQAKEPRRKAAAERPAVRGLSLALQVDAVDIPGGVRRDGGLNGRGGVGSRLQVQHLVAAARQRLEADGDRAPVGDLTKEIALPAGLVEAVAHEAAGPAVDRVPGAQRSAALVIVAQGQVGKARGGDLRLGDGIVI